MRDATQPYHSVTPMVPGESAGKVGGVNRRDLIPMRAVDAWAPLPKAQSSALLLVAIEDLSHPDIAYALSMCEDVSGPAPQFGVEGDGGPRLACGMVVHWARAAWTDVPESRKVWDAPL